MQINNRQIIITAGQSRRATVWKAQTLLLSELYERLRVPVRGTETLAEYLGYSKARQDDLKDVGGYVAGTLSGTRRKAGAVTGRDVLALDLDHIPPGETDNVLRSLEGLGCGYCVYSTRKHSPEAPRLRALLPLDRTCTADEYEPLDRRVSAYLGIDMADPSTFEASRLMYWPSCCADSHYVYAYADKPLLSVDGLLATYEDWRDSTQWPQVPGAQKVQQRLATRQEDPVAKRGTVGAFCRVYDVYRAMEELLPGVYEPCDGDDSRYTYTGGSTTGGAVVYDGGKFLFSHHATDPASGVLCNAFDLVRLHRYSQLDDEAKEGTPANRLPSFTAMCELAVAQSDVAALLSRERWEGAVKDFEGAAGDNLEASTQWMTKLSTHSRTGAVDKTADNILIILENDPMLRGRIGLDEFANRGAALGELPWDSRKGRRAWGDNDDAGTRWYLEKVYNITGEKKVTDALSLCGRSHAFDDIRDYLLGLLWDGTPRLDTLFIDYLGAEDSPYLRAVTRKVFAAAAARVMTPGCKFDTMTVITGRQGIGKSTLLALMGREWTTDNVKTFEGKEAAELIQGTWLVEIGELQAFKGADVDRIKQFLSQRVDRFRAAYGRHVQDCPRRCVFFGTSNNREYLRDKTGNRRFWPVDTGVGGSSKNIWNDLPGEVDQLWAEAMVRWRLGEPLYLPPELEREADRIREGHRESSSWEGLVQEFAERPVPTDWSKWPLDKRRTYWAAAGAIEASTMPRERVCALEVWCEALGGELGKMKYHEAAEINGILDGAEGWERYPKAMKFGYCGVQKGFVRR